MKGMRWVAGLVGVAAAAGAPGRAAIVVEGIADRAVLTDRASFRIVSEAGFDYAARLDEAPVEVDRWIEVEQPRYHELAVVRVPSGGGAAEEARVRFIVRASARGNSEWGLPPWTPPPRILSASESFTGGTLLVVAPARWALGAAIPVAARVEDAGGRRLPRNGQVTIGEPAAAVIELRRGIGSGVIAGLTAEGPASVSFAVGGLQAIRQIEIVAGAAPQRVSGVVDAAAVWPEDAWVQVTGDLEIPAGALLTIRRGARVMLDAGVTVTVRGALRIEGDLERPVVFAPAEPGAWWGGLLLAAGAELTASGAIFTGSGADPDWFSGSGYSSHRREQAFCLIDTGAAAHLSDSFIIDNRGQAFHGRDGSLRLERCLVQRCQTTGQFNGGSVTIAASALIEFPVGDSVFVDGDNDALYLTTGEHAISDTLIGWAKDDGIDAGSGGAGRVTVRGCWIEACFHEGMAWSGSGRVASVRDCVVTGCGQAVEAGYGDPDVTVEHCLLLHNAVGARYGDNYDWSYAGFLRVRDSLILNNGRDVWGRDWSSWEENLDRMQIEGNVMSAADALHPDNGVWEPDAAGAARLAEFLGEIPGGPGVGLMVGAAQQDLASAARGLECRLSEPGSRWVAVDYSIDASAAGSIEPLARGGTLLIAPGEMSAFVPGLDALPAGLGALRVRLGPVRDGEVTGSGVVYFVAGLASEQTLVPAGARWRYLDTGVPQPEEWRAPEFDDSAWPEGRAELGYGDDDERTPISGGPADRRHTTAYFRARFAVGDPALYTGLTLRLLRDDGAAVYLNGLRVVRSNLSAEEITFDTFADDRTDAEDEFLGYSLDPAHLRAGENVLAVEVHQADLTSSDLSFDLELVAALAGGRLRAGIWDGAPVLFWPEPDARLERAERPGGAWAELPGARSPWRVGVDSGGAFFRLRD